MEQGYYAYEKTDSGICILRCYGSSGSVVIPEELDGLPVTEVSAYAFAADLGQMELLLSEAKRQEAAEAVSMLMDVRRRRFPAGKKRFCL